MLSPAEGQRSREAVLNFGQYGSGKSEGWASIGAMYRATDTPGRIHIISTEWERAEQIREGSPGFDDNSTIHDATDYASLMKVTESVLGTVGPEDWIVADSIGITLDWARNVWFEDQMGMRYRDFMGSGRKVSDVGPAGWIQMSQLYKDWLLPVIESPCHVYACAQADAVNLEGAWADKGAIKNLFGRIGMKPVGEKNNPYLFRSILLSSNPSKGEFQLTTVKDSKGRDYLTSETLAPLPLGFVKSYLLDVAGWQMT